jgi:hypothetical protein
MDRAYCDEMGKELSDYLARERDKAQNDQPKRRR